MKRLVFLADDPHKAVYPTDMGVAYDWFVPDNMVEFVQEFTNKNSVKVKNIKPLSSLKKKVKTSTPSSKKKTVELTQPIDLSERVDVKLWFPVSEYDISMLADKNKMSELAARYLKEKMDTCKLEFHRGEELLMVAQGVKTSGKRIWCAGSKNYVPLTFADPEKLPEGVPEALIEHGKAGYSSSNFLETFINKYSGILPEKFNENAMAYLCISLGRATFGYHFMIGEKEKFNVNKISVFGGWGYGERFVLIYNGRYVVADSFHAGTPIEIEAYRSWAGKEKLEVPEAQEKVNLNFGEITPGVRIDDLLKPTFAEILSILK